MILGPLAGQPIPFVTFLSISPGYFIYPTNSMSDFSESISLCSSFYVFLYFINIEGSVQHEPDE